MLGPPKRRYLDQPVMASLAELVPKDNFYRHLAAKLDLSFVREWGRDGYAERGRPSIDPVVFFQLQLIMFFEGIRSERRLMETARLNLAHRWYLGYHLDEPLPDHSSLTRIRQRLGLAIFRRFFEHVVALCQEAGLVWGEELFFDATRVRANACVGRLVHPFEINGALTRRAASGRHCDSATRECAGLFACGGRTVHPPPIHARGGPPSSRHPYVPSPHRLRGLPSRRTLRPPHPVSAPRVSAREGLGKVQGSLRREHHARPAPGKVRGRRHRQARTAGPGRPGRTGAAPRGGPPRARRGVTAAVTGAAQPHALPGSRGRAARA
jgi:transposase